MGESATHSTTRAQAESRPDWWATVPRERPMRATPATIPTLSVKRPIQGGGSVLYGTSDLQCLWPSSVGELGVVDRNWQDGSGVSRPGPDMEDWNINASASSGGGRGICRRIGQGTGPAALSPTASRDQQNTPSNQAVETPASWTRVRPAETLQRGVGAGPLTSLLET